MLSDKIRAFKGNSLSSKKVFVVGCGRSGTTFLGRILLSHPNVCNIFTDIENTRTFDNVTKVALDRSKEKLLFPSVLRHYRFNHFWAAPKYYVDKSHPNLWIAEKLADIFEDATFVGIQRSCYGTVASMLKHTGVLEWFNIWKEFPIPNRFLGITEENVKDYEKLPLVSKCALRWMVHKNEMERLERVLGRRLFVIQYEKLLTNPDKTLEEVRGQLQLKGTFPRQQIKKSSLDKWKEELSEQNIQDIKTIIGDEI